jgi:hypothetical protein
MGSPDLREPRLTVPPVLLLTCPEETHLFDSYLREVLLTEGYGAFEGRAAPEALKPADLEPFGLAIIGAGAAERLPLETVASHVHAGGRAIVFRPPVSWSERLGLGPPGPTYAIARDAYLRVNEAHPWLTDFPAPDLQLPCEADVYAPGAAEPLAFLAGQRGLAVPAPAVTLARLGQGLMAVFAYDLADCIVRFHQGRPGNASNGPDPDANRDGKFTPDDLFEGSRDFALAHLPQADVHQDLLVRVIRGLLADRFPLPRLWHFPQAAPAALFVNGDGDGMNADDLRWTATTCEQQGAKFTFYLMDDQIAAFAPEEVADLRARGHAFGPHPWVSLKPTVEEWRAEVRRIMASFTAKLGFAPRSVRSHSCIFPGWDETPRLYAEVGLRLDTSFLNGYRYQSGYANGSGLPVRFVDRAGEVLDCYEQATVHGDDVLCTTKCLLPARTEDAALELSLQTMRDCATRTHGVFHPYFHPIYLGDRGGLSTRRWFRSVLEGARRLNLPSVSADGWLDFTDARRAVQWQAVEWSPLEQRLTFVLHSPLAVKGLTILLPDCLGMSPRHAVIDRERVDVGRPALENGRWAALSLSLSAGAETGVMVSYA